MQRDTNRSRASRSLSPAKRKLLEARLSRAASAAPDVHRIPERAPVSRFPATSPQRRFWFIDELNPGNPAYNMHVAIDLDGELDATRLGDALSTVVDHHDVLRSRFAFEGGELYQHVDHRMPVDLRWHARSTFSEPESLLVRLAREPFSLSEGPLFRAELLELAQDKHVLLLVLHHIVCDEPSIAIIVRELAEAYDMTGPDLPVSGRSGIRYADYAQWQHEQLPDVLRDHLQYWVEKLDGLDERASVPVDAHRTGVNMASGNIIRRTIDATLVEKVQALAAEQKMTLLPVMLAAWGALLNRYTGNRDIAVGAPASLRTQKEVEDTVGLFLNTLVLRTTVNPADSFRKLLARARDTALAAFSHQDVPLDAIVEAINPPRGRRENPFFETMIVQETAPEPINGFRGLSATHRWVDAGVCKFDLTLFFRETDDGMLLSLEYDTGLYDQRRMEAVLDHYAGLLQSLLAEPDQPIGTANYLRPDETEWLEHCSAGRWQDVGDTPTVAEQVESNLSRLDDRAAIVDQKGSVSYHELNRLVSGMADAFLASDQPTRGVVIILDRNRWAIAAMFAAWRAGACYVPLDPDYPATRIADTLEALTTTGLDEFVVVTTTKYEALLPEGTPRLLVDTPRSVQRPRDGRVVSTSNDDAAYVIFTSGSTGKPKGVVITHENLRVSTGARPIVYGEQPERFLLLSSLAFDSSVVGIHWTLSAGGTLVMADREQARSANDIASLVDEQRVTHTLMLPSLYDLVLRSAVQPWGQSLATVIVAGEACPDTLYRHHLDRVPQARLYNEYGPTEATVWATVERIDEAGTRVPIGTGVPTMKTFVLDDQLTPQAPGLPGELYLAGPALSPGYLDDTANTAFVDIPLLGSSHRLYRTGDKVRFDAEGRILFLGRVDNQVKVRGHRVELEEVNAAICGLDGVRDAATTFDEALQSLSTYIATDSPNATPERIRRKLREQVPDYMVPRWIVVLDQLPRLPNGKLDAQSLPRIEFAHGRQEPDSVEYRALKGIWAQTLKLDDPPADVSFFDLGGHSLLAARLLLDVNETFDRQMPLGKLYEVETLRDLFEYLQSGGHQDDEELLFPIRAGGDDTPLFAVRTYLKHVLPDLDGGFPVYGLTHGDRAPRDGQAALEDLASDYLEAIRRRQPGGSYRIAGYSFGALLAFEIAHQLDAAGDHVERLILIDPPPPVPEGDVRFKANRIRSRIGKAGSLAGWIRITISELARISRRFINRQRYRFVRLTDQILGRKSGRDAIRQAFADWSKKARQDYQHKAYRGDASLILMGRNGEQTAEQQLARWDGILVGRRDVTFVDGPEDHVALMQPPWSSRVAAAINDSLLTRDAGD
jgi:amino acid adenylation domain-containing protein